MALVISLLFLDVSDEKVLCSHMLIVQGVGGGYRQCFHGDTCNPICLRGSGGLLSIVLQRGVGEKIQDPIRETARQPQLGYTDHTRGS